jgi:hypothetical protein
MYGLKFASRILVPLLGLAAVVVIAFRIGIRPEQVSSAALWSLREAFAAVGASARFLHAVLLEGSTRAPAVVTGLAAILMVPLLGTAVMGLRRTKRRAARQLKRTGPAKRSHELPRLARVWIDVDGPRRTRMRLSGEMLRIGRDEDNDLQLEEAGVQRYHAVIQRTPDAEFVLLDVSGSKGRGTIVNGRRQSRARLNDGDQIQFGRTRVTFHFEPVSHALHA